MAADVPQLKSVSVKLALIGLNGNFNEIEINLPLISNGIYLLKVKTKLRTFCKKFSIHN